MEVIPIAFSQSCLFVCFARRLEVVFQVQAMSKDHFFFSHTLLILKLNGFPQACLRNWLTFQTAARLTTSSNASALLLLDTSLKEKIVMCEHNVMSI